MTFDGASEKEMGKQMETIMQDLMQNNPQIMAKVGKVIAEEAKAGAKGLPVRRIFKVLREDLPPEEWAKVEGPMKQRDANAPQVGGPAPDFHLSVMGADEKVRLSDHAGKSAVALIFGNYT